MQQILRAAGLAAIALLAVPSAHAAGLYLDDCDAFGCRGSTLSLEVEGTASGYEVTLTLDSTDYTGALVRSGVNQAGFKAITGFTDVSLLSAPNAGWSDPISAPINSSGDVCAADPGTSDHVCTAGFTDITPDAASDDEYVWVFAVEGGTLLDVADWHIGFQYADSAEATQGWIISATAPMPEPSAALAFGVGLGVVGLRLRSGSRRPSRTRRS